VGGGFRPCDPVSENGVRKAENRICKNLFLFKLENICVLHVFVKRNHFVFYGLWNLLA